MVCQCHSVHSVAIRSQNPRVVDEATTINSWKALLYKFVFFFLQAIKPVRSLCNGNSHEDDITHSADISCESDTTENESDEAKEISEGVHSASAFLQSAELPSAHEKKQHAVRKSPVLSTVRCKSLR